MTVAAAHATSDTEGPSQLYPVFLKLTERRVLVVGGGKVAKEKLAALIAARAAITVVAPTILPEILEMGVQCIRRCFRSSDLNGVWFVVSAAPPEINRVVERHARRRQIFVNAVDDARRASCYLGGVVRRGSVTLAISTSGRLPALAGMLREALCALIPDEIDEWARRGELARREWNRQRVPHPLRRPLLLQVLNDIYVTNTDPQE